jgi:FK506-binding protein 4/5
LNKKIKKNETVEYEIEVLKCKPRIKNVWEFDFPERLRLSMLKKDEAKGYFLEKRFDKSKRRYLKSLKYLENKENLNEKEMKEMNEILNLCFLNIAACDLKLENYENAIHYCDLSLSIEPENTKGLFRRAQANFKLSEFEKSKSDFHKILNSKNLDKPTEQQVKLELKNVEREQQKYENQMKKMFSGVFKE